MLTEEQREERRKYVGSSDAAAICGVDPHQNAHDVYLQKVFDHDPITNEAIEIGNALEDDLIEFAERHLNLKIHTGLPPVIGPCGIIAANLDGYLGGDVSCRDISAIVEAKTTGLDGFGDDELVPNMVPTKVIIQTAAAFHCCPHAKVAWVPVMIAKFRGLHWALYCVERDDRVVAKVARACHNFWVDHVLKKVPPPDMPPHLDVVKRVKRVANKRVPVPDNLIMALAEVRDAKGRMGKAEEPIKAALLARMEDAEEAYGMDNPSLSVTNFEVTRRGYTVKPYSYRSLLIQGDEEHHD